jgi:hypothetical protein
MDIEQRVKDPSRIYTIVDTNEGTTPEPILQNTTGELAVARSEFAARRLMGGVAMQSNVEPASFIGMPSETSYSGISVRRKNH